MGFRLSSFLGGAATQAVTTIEAREKEARDTGLLAGKSLYAQYAAITKENAEVSAEIKDNLEVIKTAWPNIDEKTALEMANRKSVMGAVTSMVKDGSVDPKLVDINMFRKFAETNAPEVAIDKMKQTAEIGTMVKGLMTKKETDAALSEKKPKGMMEEYYEGFANKGATEYAASVGVPIEQMKSIKRLSERPMDNSISFDLTQLRAAKKSGDIEDAAKVKFLTAQAKKDPAAIAAATADLAAFQAMKEVLTTDQQKLLEKTAVLKSVILTGGPEAKAAQLELNKVWKLEKAEKEAISIKEPKGVGEDKVPALGSLESFTGKAVTRTVQAIWGRRLDKELVTIATPDGNSTIKYIGNDPKIKAEVEATKTMAADRALSLYPQDNVAVRSIKQSYRTTDVEQPAPPPPTPTTRVEGTAPRRGSGLGASSAPAATLLPESIEAKVKASGVAYEPTKYDYRVAPDGTVQRKAK